MDLLSIAFPPELGFPESRGTDMWGPPTELLTEKCQIPSLFYNKNERLTKIVDFLMVTGSGSRLNTRLRERLPSAPSEEIFRVVEANPVKPKPKTYGRPKHQLQRSYRESQRPQQYKFRQYFHQRFYIYFFI
jgi:hypothetical protein